MDDIDRQQCQDIACCLEGHRRCREVDYDLGDVLSVQVSEG